MHFVLRPLRLMFQSLTRDCGSRQLAVGCALGLAIGLLPKDNLLAGLLMIVLCAARVNLGIALLTVFICSWVGILIDPLSHRIGLAVLTADWLQPTWTRLYDTPLVPWTHFNNTVVMGSFCLGILLFYPVYRLTEPLFVRYTPQVSDRLRRFRLVRVLQGAEVVERLGRQ